jgi:inner membrane protein
MHKVSVTLWGHFEGSTPSRSARGTGGIAWLDSSDASLAQLKHLQQTNCHVDAWLRFARMPSVDADTATDLRFGNLGGANFSTIDYAARAGSPCPAWLPHWGQPRADLLGVLPSK